jgi:hypothetical protein
VENALIKTSFHNFADFHMQRQEKGRLEAPLQGGQTKKDCMGKGISSTRFLRHIVPNGRALLTSMDRGNSRMPSSFGKTQDPHLWYVTPLGMYVHDPSP